MAVETQAVEYSDGDVELRGMLAWDPAGGRRPGVMVAHAWAGRGQFEDEKAVWLAARGYVGFAIDVYGAGILGADPEENAALMQPFLDDRSRLLRRLAVALDVLRNQDMVDEGRTAIMGFCFGGLAALDLARSGADIDGAISIHGIFAPPPETRNITAKVLALHGWDDPMATPSDVVAFAEEMSKAGADWQIHGYGNTLHAFTSPTANDPAMGVAYSEIADKRCFQAIENFLAELYPAH
ncbi:MAG: dienelactone hydrolase family protein [Pseudomonadales bacterium]|jgi:dienelactone hydrolase